jgi:hypothetical protein
MHSARRLAPAIAAIAASKLRAKETRRAEIATPRRFAEPKGCLPSRLDSVLVDALVCRAAASAWEAGAQSTSTAYQSTAPAASSLQKINSLTTSSVST